VLATVSERGAGFRSVGDPWADTTTPHGRLMLTVLGGLAEFERALILSRTGEGRTRAMARGVEVREEAQADAASDHGSQSTAGRGGGLGGHRAKFQREPQHHFEVVKGWLQ
jgi:DNA invertase Pin-like site-specific DNA recombinase